MHGSCFGDDVSLKRPILDVIDPRLALLNRISLFLLGRLLAQHFFDLQINGAFQALFLEGTAHLVGFFEAAAVAEIIGVAAAATIKARPALHAGRFGKHVAGLELGADLGHSDAVKDRTDFKLGVADELVAGIEIAFGADGQIVMAGATAGEALGQAGTVAEVNVEMEEVVAVAALIML